MKTRARRHMNRPKLPDSVVLAFFARSRRRHTRRSALRRGHLDAL